MNLLLILSRKKNLHFEKSLRASKPADCDIQIISPTLKQVNQWLSQFDKSRYQKVSVIPRLGSYKFNESLNNTKKLIQKIKAQLSPPQGLTVLNDPQGLTLARDKWTTYQVLRKAKISMPQSELLPSTPKAQKKVLDEMKRALLKPRFSSQGRGITWAHRVRLEKKLPRKNFILQKTITESLGQDVRVLILDNQVLGAIARQNLHQFKANAAQGSQAQMTPLTKKEKDLCLKACRTAGLHFVGIDFLRSNKGPLLIDLNGCPGFEQFEKVTEISVSDNLFQFLAKKSTASIKRNKKAK